MNLDGTRVAIGAIGDDGGGLDAGHVRVYDWGGATWTQVGADIDGEAGGDQSGRSVSLSSDGLRVTIGSEDNNGAGSAAGHVRVYDWDGANWVQYDFDIDGEAANDRSGSAISLSRDGFRLAIGAEGNDGTAAGAGHVRVYDLTVLLETESLKLIAMSLQEDVNLNWSTFKEDENGYYIIERRTTNGALQQLARINVNQENERHYTFLDTNVPSGNFYYFLSQYNAADIQEQSALSFVSHNSNLEISNTGNNEFEINSPSVIRSYVLYNMGGSKIYEQHSVDQKIVKVSLADSKVTPGIYLIKIENEDGVISQQLYKAAQ